MNDKKKKKKKRIQKINIFENVILMRNLAI